MPKFDTKLIGTHLPPFAAVADADTLRAFAHATGQTDPVYFDQQAARAAGHRDLAMPPTFLFCLEMTGAPDPMAPFNAVGADYGRTLHGEQHFTYHRLAYAGETLRFAPRITDIYERKAGALRFFVWETKVEDESGSPVADLRSVMVVVREDAP